MPWEALSYNAQMQLDKIFKAYDIRGRIDNGELDEGIAEAIGAAFASFVATPRLAVGRDIRVSSGALADAFIAGVTSQGINVDDVGEVATDMVYYYSGGHTMPAAMITASHLPPEWNGIKLNGAGAAPISRDTGLTEIKRLTMHPPASAESRGTVSYHDIRTSYVDHLYGIVDADRFSNLRVAVDAGNGMAGVIIDQVFQRIPATLTGLYLEPDGTFPNHPADPLRPENLEDLIGLMREQPHDLGVAFDADADRAFFVDDHLVPLSGSTTTAILAKYFLDNEPGATIVHNVIVSRAVPEMVRRFGGHPVRTRVGHSFIKAVMAESGAVFGGEHSAHYYFRENFRADSGTLAMLVLLLLLSEDGRPLSELRREFEPYSQSGELNFRVENQQASMEAVEAALDGQSDWLDGLTLEWEDHWFNLRPSNTEPLLRLNVEAPDPERVASLTAQVSAIIEGAGGARA